MATIPLQTTVITPDQNLATENSEIQLINSYVGQYPGSAVVAGANGSDVTTDTMASLIVPANFMALPGRRLRMTGFGGFGSNAHVKTVAWVLTGSNLTLATILGTTASSGGSWKADLEIVDNSNYAATPTYSQTYFGTFNLAGTVTNVTGTTTLATTAAITMAIAGSTNTAAASDVTCTFFGGEILK